MSGFFGWTVFAGRDALFLDTTSTFPFKIFNVTRNMVDSNMCMYIYIHIYYIAASNRIGTSGSSTNTVFVLTFRSV